MTVSPYQRVEVIVYLRTCDINVGEISFQNFYLTAHVQCNIEKQGVVTFTRKKCIFLDSMHNFNGIVLTYIILIINFRNCISSCIT